MARLCAPVIVTLLSKASCPGPDRPTDFLTSRHWGVSSKTPMHLHPVAARRKLVLASLRKKRAYAPRPRIERGAPPRSRQDRASTLEGASPK